MHRHCSCNAEKKYLLALTALQVIKTDEQITETDTTVWRHTWSESVILHHQHISSNLILHLHFSHLADAFIQSDLQMRTIEAIKTNKRATTCKCYYKSRLA